MEKTVKKSTKKPQGKKEVKRVPDKKKIVEPSNNKKIIFWIITAIVFIGIFVGILIFIDADPRMFKKSHEILNNTLIPGTELRMRNVKISKKNPIVYANEETILKKIDKKDTFIVYFGFASCPWCRSIVETMLELAEDYDVKKIYYVDVLNIRDKMEVIDGEIVTTKKGTDGYYELLTKFDSVLSDYNITNEDGDTVFAGEKRIYAPNVVIVVEGEVKELKTGTPGSLIDPFMELTKDIKKDIYSELECVFKCLNPTNTCSVNESCEKIKI